ncbi:MAG: dephospho-CoA kinase [Lachnospiraceae bacterium]
MKQNKMIVLGITGGIGAGKTTVLSYLKENYAVVAVQADHVGYLLMRPGGPCYDPMLSLFGERILNPDRSINRKTVGALVFTNLELLQRLNAIIHPKVQEYIQARIDEERSRGTAFFVVEAALLLEAGYDAICDDLWYIDVDEAVRRERLKQERGYSDQKITNILANQMKPEEFRQRCQYTIRNNGDLAYTYRQIDQRMKRYEIM